MRQNENFEPYFLKGALTAWGNAPVSIGYGAILVCSKGSAVIAHNFRRWEVREGTVMTLFPNDTVHLQSADSSFSTEMLVYSAEMLRSASLQLEHVVYEWLRNDCCTTDPWVFRLTSATFGLLGFYMEEGRFGSSREIILLQLKAYFLGLYDTVMQNPAERRSTAGRGDRIRDQFNLFMEIMEKEYRAHHDVNYYAGRLSVTPKHLTTITRRVSGKSAKELIDEYIVMQLKLTLTSTTASIKEIAWDYNFPSTAFLCSYFSSRTGITPLQYRRSEQGAG